MFKLPDEYCVQRGIDGGFYTIKLCGQSLNIVASNGFGWEHVSVTHKKRCPFWHEMHRIKNIFWDDEDTVIQYHPPKSVYINCHPHCLHMWRKINTTIDTPPWILV